MGDTPIKDDQAETGVEPANLKFLRILVTVLTLTMIGGLITVVAVFVTRFPAASGLMLPDVITLPDGTQALSYTVGPDWYGIVTAQNTILIFDRNTGALRQTVTIE